MAIRVVISDSPPEGVRWQVVEGKVVLKTGTANSQPEAFIAGNRAIKELIEERTSATQGPED
jgi:hypothetical protein